MNSLFTLLVLFVWLQFSFGEITNIETKQHATERINSKFLDDAAPKRYRDNILIQIQGKPTKVDSLIFRQVVDTLNTIVENENVYIISNGPANLIVEISKSIDSCSRFTGHHFQNNEIVRNNVSINLPETMANMERKKVIFYYLVRSIVVFKDYPSYAKAKGSVFTETNPDQIVFHPVDFKIIKEIYSRKFNVAEYSREINNESNNHINKWSGYNYNLLINLFAIMVSMLYLITISQRGFFNKHHYEFGKFLKQGFVAFIAFLIYSGIQNFLTSLLFLKSVNIATSSIVIILPIGLLGLVSIVFIFVIERFILKGKENLLLEVVVPLFTTMIIPIIIPIILFLGISNSTSSNDFQDQFWVIITAIVSFTALIAIARAFYIYLNKQSENIIRQKDVELAQIGELHKQAELQSLQAKINPHFLYNALNSIASLASTDAKKTEQMALGLSDFFKYSINRGQKQLNSLSEELNAIRTYLEIEKVRFGDRLSFEIDCPEELLDIQIPRLLIQPLVENAIKHGLSQITEKGSIRISVIREEKQLKIRIYDNGPAFPEGPLSGYGIQNTQERVSLLYGGKASINWYNGVEKFIELSLPI